VCVCVCWVPCVCSCLSGSQFRGGIFIPTLRHFVHQRLKSFFPGDIVPIADLSIGPPPKHLSGKGQLLLSEQLLRLHREINAYFGPSDHVTAAAATSSSGASTSLEHAMQGLSVNTADIADSSLSPLRIKSGQSGCSDSDSVPYLVPALACHQPLRMVLCGPMGKATELILQENKFFHVSQN
jgi:hypothetical protein